MRALGIFSMIALAGMLTTTPASAIDTSVTTQTPDDRTVFPYGDAVTRDATQLQNAPTASQASVSIEGVVAAVDRDSGRLVLNTDNGIVGLNTWPDEIANVDVGDLVRVTFVSDDGD